MAIELHGGKPLNPLVNAGAMATVSLVNGSDSDEIWGNMIHNFNNFANTALTVNQEIYKSESATNQHNRGIAWLLDSYGYFYNTPPMIVDLYTRMCSLNITASQLALMGACYANGGVNPVSKKRVVKEENVPPIWRKCACQAFMIPQGTGCTRPAFRPSPAWEAAWWP